MYTDEAMKTSKYVWIYYIVTYNVATVFVHSNMKKGFPFSIKNGAQNKFLKLVSHLNSNSILQAVNHPPPTKSIH